MKPLIKQSLREKLLNEVRYINPSKDESPISDSETIRVFHGFNNFKDVEKVLKNGLAGKEKAARIYSYETGNNPYGLFVSVSFRVAKEFSGGVIIEFSSKVSDLEAPVWVGGRSYFVQGEYTKSFKDLDEREQQRLINRQNSGENPYNHIAKSDRPELADTIFDNPEHQALYIGNLNPNMIKNIWYNEVLHKDRRTNGPWVKYSRKDFINKLSVVTKRNEYNFFLPNDDFDLSKFKKYIDNDEQYFFSQLLNADDYKLKTIFHMYPKQIEQFKKLKISGTFDKYNDETAN